MTKSTTAESLAVVLFGYKNHENSKKMRDNEQNRYFLIAFLSKSTKMKKHPIIY
jgi:hypothetical protein